MPPDPDEGPWKGGVGGMDKSIPEGLDIRIADFGTLCHLAEARGLLGLESFFYKTWEAARLRRAEARFRMCGSGN